MVQKQSLNKKVFINCPFDGAYKEHLSAILFTVLHLGYIPKTALQLDNAAQSRLNKIINLIVECDFSIHDLSMIEIDKAINLPRFNMPFECGLFYGVYKFRPNKKALIFEKNRYNLKKCLTDLNGIDPRFHKNNIKTIIRYIRDWLNTHQTQFTFPSADIIFKRYEKFKRESPKICKAKHLNYRDLDTTDLIKIMSAYIQTIV